MIDIIKVFISGIEIEEKEALLETNEEELGKGITIIAKGENNLITGKPGHGKSFITSFIVSQFLYKTNEWFLISIDDLAVILLDTEQGIGQIVDWFLVNVYHETDYNKIREFESLKNYKIYSIKDEEDKLLAFKRCIDECKVLFKKKHLLIVIDNLTSFVNNTLESSNEILNTINQYRGDNTLISILHENHKSDSKNDPTGHIGSQAQRNAAIHWNVLKEEQSYKLTCKKSRFHDLKDVSKLLLSTKKDKTLFVDDCKLDDLSDFIKKPSGIDLVFNEIQNIFDSCDLNHELRIRKNLIKELERRTGKKDKQLYNDIKRLINMGKLILRDNGSLDYLPF